MKKLLRLLSSFLVKSVIGILSIPIAAVVVLLIIVAGIILLCGIILAAVVVWLATIFGLDIKSKYVNNNENNVIQGQFPQDQQGDTE